MRRLRVQLTVILTNLVGNAIKYSLPTSDELAGSGR